MTPEREAEIRRIAKEWPLSLTTRSAMVDLLEELDALRWVVNQHEPPHYAFARVVNERNAARAEHRQFLADLGSIVAGQPVEPAEALRRVEELVRERETR